jgi:carboxyl-terminal processing protease
MWQVRRFITFRWARQRVRRSLLACIAGISLLAASDDNQFARAARALDETIARHYAYLDKLPGGVLPQSEELRSKRAAVVDARSLLVYAEERIASLADHHAITGRSFRDSWAVVPTYADIWIVAADGEFVVDSVRDNSPAAYAQVRAGDRLVSVDGVPIAQAVAAFWATMGLDVTPARADHAARVLLAGRRDRKRRFSLQDRSGAVRELSLPSLYAYDTPELPPVSVCRAGERMVVRFNNSLGDNATIAAFDDVMRAVPAAKDLILDLRETPSGGNTTVARAIMGWFVRKPRGYQVHNRPDEERETGIARQWVEQVLPRTGLHRASPPTVLVGRWTGSMGEGLAIGLAAIGAEVRGTKMAGLNGSVEDLRVGETDLYVKLPTERLLTVHGLPREAYVARTPDRRNPVPDTCTTPLTARGT